MTTGTGVGRVQPGWLAGHAYHVGLPILAITVAVDVWFWNRPWCAGGITVERWLSVSLLVLPIAGLTTLLAGSRRMAYARTWVVTVAVIVASLGMVVGTIVVREAFGQDFCVQLLSVPSITVSSGDQA